MIDLESTFKSSLEKLRTHAPFYSENDIRFWLLHDFINTCGTLSGFRLATEYPVPKSKGHYDIVILNPEGKFFLVAEVKYYYDGFSLNSFKSDLQRLQDSSAHHKYFICGIREDHHQIVLDTTDSLPTGQVQVFKFPTPRWNPTQRT